MTPTDDNAQIAVDPIGDAPTVRMRVPYCYENDESNAEAGGDAIEN